MSNIGEPKTLHQMAFFSPERREEVLWVERMGDSTYRVLNVPVWLYGISVGTIVEGGVGGGKFLEFIRVIRSSDGGTVRCIVDEGQQASRLYLDRVIPDARHQHLRIGPATFFDPALVAIHVKERAKLPEFGEYLQTLTSQGLLDQWEIADPDVYAEETEANEESFVEVGREPLIHQLPSDPVGTDRTS